MRKHVHHSCSTRVGAPAGADLALRVRRMGAWSTCASQWDRNGVKGAMANRRMGASLIWRAFKSRLRGFKGDDVGSLHETVNAFAFKTEYAPMSQ